MIVGHSAQGVVIGSDTGQHDDVNTSVCGQWPWGLRSGPIIINITFHWTRIQIIVCHFFHPSRNQIANSQLISEKEFGNDETIKCGRGLITNIQLRYQ